LLDDYSLQIHKSRVLNVLFKSIPTHHTACELRSSILESYTIRSCHRILVKSSFPFMQPPMLSCTLCKELLYQNFVFSENLSPYTIVRPCCTWRYCRSHFTSSFVRHVSIIDCTKLKNTILGRNIHTKFRLNPFRGSRVESWGQTDGQTGRNDKPCMCSVHAGHGNTRLNKYRASRLEQTMWTVSSDSLRHFSYVCHIKRHTYTRSTTLTVNPLKPKLV
jgi:hypothetical protein